MSKPLVIFDCDGVLIDSEVIYVDVETEFLGIWGIDVDRSWYIEEFMALGRDTARRKLSALVEERTGAALSDAEFAAMKAESRRRIIDELKPVDGIESLLENLPLDRCVASSTKLDFLHRKLDQVNLSRFFGDAIYSGDLVENGKPAPDLYLYCAEKMGYAPANCIVIEDSVNGVKGGKAAGMLTVGFAGGTHCLDGHGESLLEAGADMLIASHAELATWIAEETRAA